MSAEPYVVRRLGLAQVIPLVVFVGWLALLQVAGFDFPTGIIVVVAVYVVVSTALTLDRLRIDEKGVRMRPAGRIGWEHIDHVTARGFELDPARVDQSRSRLLRGRRLLLGKAGQRRVLLRHVRRRPERLIRDFGRRVLAGGRVLRDLRIVGRDVGHARSPTRSVSGAPHGRSTSGSTTEPSSRCPFSSRAIMCRHVTAVPLSVATWRGPPPSGR